MVPGSIVALRGAAETDGSIVAFEGNDVFKAKKKDKFALGLRKIRAADSRNSTPKACLMPCPESESTPRSARLVEGSEDHARKRFDELVAQGIKPSDTVVDYGCGTLRLGVRFIDYLDADRYVGLDIDDRIIAAGRDHLRADLVEAKRPVLEVISPESLARAAAKDAMDLLERGSTACAAGPFERVFHQSRALRAWRCDRALQRKGASQAREALVQEPDARWSSRARGGRGLRHAADLPAPGQVETASAHKLLILLASISAAWRANGRGVLPAPRMSKNRHERPQAQ